MHLKAATIVKPSSCNQDRFTRRLLPPPLAGMCQLNFSAVVLLFAVHIYFNLYHRGNKIWDKHTKKNNILVQLLKINLVLCVRSVRRPSSHNSMSSCQSNISQCDYSNDCSTLMEKGVASNLHNISYLKPNVFFPFFLSYKQIICMSMCIVVHCFRFKLYFPKWLRRHSSSFCEVWSFTHALSCRIFAVKWELNVLGASL